MSSLPPLDAIANGTPADGSVVDGNFDTLATFVDQELVNRDGSIAMTGELSLSSSTPSGALVAASKGYVDGVATSGKVAIFTRTTDISVLAGGSGTVSFEAESNDLDGWWAVGTPTVFTCPTTGVYAVSLRMEATGASGFTDLDARLVGTSPFSIGGDTTVSLAGAGAKTATSGVVGYFEAGNVFTVSYEEMGASAGSTITDVAVVIVRLS